MLFATTPITAHPSSPVMLRRTQQVLSPQIYREVPIPTITLANNSDNTSVIEANNGKLVNVTLSDRTLYKDGSWNTLCLPFSLTAEQVTNQLDPGSLMTLQSSSFSNGTLTLNFISATTIEAGKPYIIKWTGDSPLESPYLYGRDHCECYC